VSSRFSNDVVKKGTGSLMTTIAAPIIKCPVCESHGAMLHHDIRAALVYSCQKCMHEWEIDPAEEPPQADSRLPERTRVLLAAGGRTGLTNCDAPRG